MGSGEDEKVVELLRHEAASDDRIREFLAPFGFADRQAAYRSLRRIAGGEESAAELAPYLPILLRSVRDAPDPDRALINLDRFLQRTGDRRFFFREFTANPRTLELLATLFASSQFLTEVLLRNPEYLGLLTDRRELALAKSAEQFLAEAEAATSSTETPLAAAGAGEGLLRFQRRELLRIGACDFFGLLDLPSITAQLSFLAASVVRVCLAGAARQTGVSTEGFAVIAMGKLGGRELNYSSDIDLLFIAAGDDRGYERLGRKLIEILASVTSDGFLYRVDMRLRPWGRSGALVATLDGHLAYLRTQARLWEKQAHLKARTIAGDHALGAELATRAIPILADVAPERVRAEIHAMKQRIETRLRRGGRVEGDVKLGEGSIRDVEFVTQYLQLAHAGHYPQLSCPNTLDALARLSAAGLLRADEYRILADGYVFLRTIEHALQLMEYRQTHSLPARERDLDALARRLGFQGPGARSHFLTRYREHSDAIRRVYRRHLEESPPPASESAPNDPAASAGPVARHLARLGAPYSQAFSRLEIERHAEMAARLDDQNVVRVDAGELDGGRWRLTIVGYDSLGALSLICGLLVAYGFDILDGQIFTYEPGSGSTAQGSGAARSAPRRRNRRRRPGSNGRSRRKIVDVFTVRSLSGEAGPDLWRRYTAELSGLLKRLEAGERRQVQGELARRVATVLPERAGRAETLYPVEIEIDNDSTAQYTVLRIDAPDTVGFLYELTNALALNGVYIARMSVETIRDRVRDTLWVTDSGGNKIVSPEKERELRAATVLVKHFTHLLPHSPNPQSALLHFRAFLGQLLTRPNWPDELASLERPEVLDALARLLGVSDFLWEDFLRMQHDNLFPVVRNVEGLSERKSQTQIRRELEECLQAGASLEARRAALNAFKDREMFRVDMRNILGYITEFGQFSAELTDLAEAVVDAACRLCEAELRAVYGAPFLDDGSPSPLAICGLGKLGGRELGFASDIELVFVYEGEGRTDGPVALSASEFYVKFVQTFVQLLETKREGIFEVDLRLRPYGRAGSMAVSLEAFRRYYGPGGPAWPYERQALVKLRPIAGDLRLGERVVRVRDELVYNGEPFDVAALRAMRERQIRQRVTAGTFNAKFSRGGLVDVEYLVQALQIVHGARNPALRQTNTREAMAALAAAGILTPGDFDRLREAHVFLRRLINALRMVRGNARELTVPPRESPEFAFLARRLYHDRETERLSADLSRYATAVREITDAFFASGTFAAPG